MADAKKTSKKATASKAESAQTSAQNPEPTAEKQPQILSTGLEDYGRWRSLYQNYQRPKNEKPFRRGRICC